MWIYPRICPAPWKYITDHFSTKLGQKVNNPKWPQDDLWPQSVEVTCTTLTKDHWSQLTWKYIKVCGHSDLFQKTLTKRSMTPRWSLTLLLFRSQMQLYLRIIVSKSHGNTSMYVDTVTIFQKTLPKRLMTPNNPRWPLTPLLSWLQVWLYPRNIVSESHANTSM